MGFGSNESVNDTSEMWMWPQNSKILRLISLLKPDMRAVEAIITATLSATAAMAMRITTREKFFPPEKARRRAMKKGRFKRKILSGQR